MLRRVRFYNVGKADYNFIKKEELVVYKHFRGESLSEKNHTGQPLRQRRIEPRNIRQGYSNIIHLLHLSPIFRQILHKTFQTGTAQQKRFPFHYGTLILYPLHMLQINQITFVPSGKIELF